MHAPAYNIWSYKSGGHKEDACEVNGVGITELTARQMGTLTSKASPPCFLSSWP